MKYLLSWYFQQNKPLYGDRPESGPRGHQSVETGTGGGLYHHPPTEQVGYSIHIQYLYKV